MSISTVTSEALQLKLRQLLPSQQGFGTDLSASDTIIPIIDLTAAAEGSDVGENLQTALAFNSQTTNTLQNSSAVQENTAGFYLIVAQSTMKQRTASTGINSISLNDGATSKFIFNHKLPAGSLGEGSALNFKEVVFLRTGDQLDAVSNSVDSVLNITTRQIATVNGTLVQPSGFTPE